MLKLVEIHHFATATGQPPSGGCVLKPFVAVAYLSSRSPAAFRRLCVETGYLLLVSAFIWPAAFRRLCVETVLKT